MAAHGNWKPPIRFVLPLSSKLFVLAVELLNCPTVYSYQLVTVMQAQKVLGNKWTEIAKVVSGRCVFLIGLLFFAR